MDIVSGKMVKIKEDRVNDLVSNPTKIEQYLKIVEKEYRLYDPGNYLYKLLLSKNSEIFKRENIELLYTTLIAWNMDSRGAKLSDFTQFYESILKNKEKFSNLQRYRLESITDDEFDSIMKTSKILFEELELITKKENAPKLVTYSKTMHFIVPKLIVPIDRKYTLTFFKNNTIYDNSKSFELFETIHHSFRKIAQNINLDRYKDNVWNLTIPKIIDNLIIGYVKKNL